MDELRTKRMASARMNDRRQCGGCAEKAGMYANAFIGLVYGDTASLCSCLNTLTSRNTTAFVDEV